MGGGLTPSAEMQSVYFTAPADWANHTQDALFGWVLPLYGVYSQVWIKVKVFTDGY